MIRALAIVSFGGALYRCFYPVDGEPDGVYALIATGILWSILAEVEAIRKSLEARK